MIKDSGERREFETGAVRDMAAGKGRFDLMPLGTLVNSFDDGIVYSVYRFVETGQEWALVDAIQNLYNHFPTPYHAWLALAKHFENGAIKYGEYNWQKGIETCSYIDSALRHYCKFMAGYEDEPHEVACLWNLVCCLWTIINKPELNSFPVEREDKE